MVSGFFEIFANKEIDREIINKNWIRFLTTKKFLLIKVFSV